MGFFGRRDGEDYRPARDGEKADFNLNGVGQVYTKRNNPLHESNIDDGRSGIENPGDKKARSLFGKGKKEEPKDPNAIPILKVGEDVSGKGFDGPSRYNNNGTNDRLPFPGTNNLENEEFDNDSNRSYKSAVKGRHQLLNRGGFKGFMKRNVPTMALAVGIITIGIMMGGSQSVMGFATIAQIKKNFDSIGISSNMRTTSFLKFQLDAGRVKDCTKAKIFGGKKFKLSDKQIAKLETNSSIRMEYGGWNGKKVVSMSFEDVDGVRKTVTADNFESVYNSNEKFRSEYFENSKTWRGSVAQWFDSHIDALLKKIGISRDFWNGYKSTGDAKTDEESFRAKVSDAAPDDTSGGIAAHHHEEDAEYNEDGSVKQDAVSEKINEEPTTTLKTGDSPAEVKNKLSSFSEKYGKVTGAISAATNSVCTIMNVISAIGLLVAAYQTTQAIEAFVRVAEAQDKAMQKDSKETPVDAVNNQFVKEEKATFLNKYNEEETRTRAAMEAADIQASFNDEMPDGDDLGIRAMNMSTMFTAVPSAVAPLLSTAQDALKFSVEGFKYCTAAKLAAAIADAVMDAVEIAGCIISFGIGCAVSALKSMAISVGFSVLISAVIGAIVPWVAQVLARNVLVKLAGENWGNAIYEGGMKMMSGNHRNQGGSFLSPKAYGTFLGYQKEYETEIARYERENLSPFDIRSEYTFLGSLVRSSIPIVSKMRSVTGVFSQINNTVSKSISGLFPGANAAEIASKVQANIAYSKKYCPYSDGMTAVTAACYDLVGSDMRTATPSYDVADVINRIDTIPGNFKENKTASADTDNNGTYFANVSLADDDDGPDNVEIDPNGRLAQWIIICGEMVVGRGIASQEAIDHFTSQSWGTVGDAIKGGTPILGDIFDAYDNAEVLKYMDYVLGDACVAEREGGTNGFALVEEHSTELAAATTREAKIDIFKASLEDVVNPTPSWEEAKYYQRFVEDQRLAEAMGIIEKSAVTSFLEDYRKEHPIDTSYEGMLAHYSGMSKEKVSLLLDYIEVEQGLADYNPEEMYPLAHEKTEDPNYVIEEDTIIDTHNMLAKNQQIEFDRRRLATIG